MELDNILVTNITYLKMYEQNKSSKVFVNFNYESASERFCTDYRQQKYFIIYSNNKRKNMVENSSLCKAR